MSQIDWIGFIPASVAVILSPGPGSLLVARTAVSVGVRGARMAMLGILTGDLFLVLLSFFGVSALFSAYPSLFHTLQIAGASYLIYLGVTMMLNSPSKSSSVNLPDLSGNFRKGVTITLANPKAIFFFMAFFPLFIKPGREDLYYSYAILSILFLTANQIYLLFLSQVSTRIGSAFQQNIWLQSMARYGCGVLFIFFGIKIAFFPR
jgi:leucine efflux protein